MSGGKSPRTKGNRFERELVQLALDSQIPAKRAWGSNGAALNLHPTVDCLIGTQRVQAKRRACVASWLCPTEYVDAVAVRPDRGEALIVMRYTDWLDLVAAARVTQAEPTPEPTHAHP